MARKQIFSIRIGDLRQLYDASWRRSCARIDEALRLAGFILIYEKTPKEQENTGFLNTYNICSAYRSNPVKELDYEAIGDFNKFFQIAMQYSIQEEMYLAECRESSRLVPMISKKQECAIS